MVDGFQGATPQAKVKAAPSRSGPDTNVKFFATDKPLAIERTNGLNREE